MDIVRSTTYPVELGLMFSTSAIYTEMASFAQFGPMYRRIRRCYMGIGTDGANEALVEIRGSGKDIPKYAVEILSLHNHC